MVIWLALRLGVECGFYGVKLPILWRKSQNYTCNHNSTWEYHVILACKCIECVDIADITWGAIHVISELHESNACKIDITYYILTFHVKLELNVANIRWRLELAVGVP
jgi:hypothetical protein